METYRHKQSVDRDGERLVGGEPARRILEIVRGFPLTRNYAGGVAWEVTGTATDLEMFERAYNWIEMEFLAAKDGSRKRNAFATLDATQWQYFIINQLMYWAKFAVGDTREDVLWGSGRRESVFGAEPNGVCIECGPLPSLYETQNQVLLPRYSVE
jgi:hypothetical protein